MKWLTHVMATLSVLLVLAPTALASGSYVRRAPRPPDSVDRASYETGKKIFAGEFTPTDEARASEAEKQVLEDLQSQLPRTVQTRVDLPELNGKLSDEQMEALQYFLEKRYKVR